MKPKASRTSSAYADGPCYPELAAILVVGLFHVVLELSISEPVGWAYSATISVALALYVAWRAWNAPGALRAWGMRRDNFWQALGAQAAFGVVGAAVLVGYGLATGSFAFPWGFWLTLALYPIWGITQQFALQNLIGRHVAGFLAHPVAIAGTAAILFAVSHIPRWYLVVLTLFSGFFFTLIYRRFPNLWAVGIIHGILGSLAVYLVLGEDPGGAIWGFLADYL